MQPIKLSKHFNCEIFCRCWQDDPATQFWFCPAKAELVDRVTYEYLLSDDERKGCIPVAQISRSDIQRAFFEQQDDEVRAMWEESIRECTDEQSFEEVSWKIIEDNFHRHWAYLEFAADYKLSYAENWCRENQIPFVETEELVDPPTHPYMFIDDVEDVLSYLKQGWSVEDYMNMLRQFNPDVEDFSAITPAIEAAVEQMKKDSGKQA